jgi:hypothetical protein
VVSSTFPHIDAGDPGRIAITYLGSTDAHLLGTPDLRDDPWNGNPHTAPGNATFDLFVTVSLNALDDEPIFHTFRLTDDPVQVGSICIASGDCEGGNRNLLDFNDLHIDRDGRVFIAYADGCIGECATKADRAPGDSRSARGMVAILEIGPSLFEGVELRPLAA